ncbi:hypothetical protein [Gordonia sp. NPDC003376]
MGGVIKRVRVEWLVWTACRHWPTFIETSEDAARLRHTARILAGANLVLNDRDKHKVAVLSHLGGALEELSPLEPSRPHLLVAIRLHTRALTLAPEGSADRATCASNLLTALLRLHETTGSSQVLQEATIVAKEVQGEMDGRTKDERDLPGLAALTSLALHRRHRQDPTELRSLVHDYRTTLGADRSSGDIVSSRHHANLGSAYLQLHRLSGDTQDVDDAIAEFRTARSIAERLGTGVGEAQSALASGLAVRYDLAGESLDDIVESVELHEKSFTDPTFDRHELNRRRNAFAIALVRLSRRTRRRADLDRAVDLFEQIPDPDPDVTVNLAHALLERADRFETDDATQAATIFDEMIETSAREDDPLTHAFTVAALATALFETATTEADIYGAAARTRSAIALIGTDHPDRARMFYELGCGLFDDDAPPSRRLLARKAFQTAMQEGVGPDFWRINTAAMAAHASASLGDWNTAAADYHQALTLTVASTRPWRPPRDNHSSISEADTLLEDAAAAALNASDPRGALAAIEHARIIVLDNATGLGRTDALRHAAPDHWARAEQLRQMLTALDWTATDDAVLHRLVRTHRRGGR